MAHLSIWLLLLALMLAASMMHPGFATLFALTVLLILLLALRFVAHYEGEQMMKIAQENGKSIRGRQIRELSIGIAIGVGVMLIAVFFVRHFPVLMLSS